MNLPSHLLYDRIHHNEEQGTVVSTRGVSRLEGRTSMVQGGGIYGPEEGLGGCAGWYTDAIRNGMAFPFRNCRLGVKSVLMEGRNKCVFR